jgi:hypothetical protein
MPSQSRAQRRRQAANQQQRRPQPPRPNAGAAESPESADSVLTLDSLAQPAATPTAPPSPARQPSSRTTRRVLSRSAPEPVDHSKDYVAVRTDLRWIAIWSALLFGTMIALKLSGLV